MFGKVLVLPSGEAGDPSNLGDVKRGEFVSCCVTVGDMQRRLYFLPREGVEHVEVYSEVKVRP